MTKWHAFYRFHAVQLALFSYLRFLAAEMQAHYHRTLPPGVKVTNYIAF